MSLFPISAHLRRRMACILWLFVASRAVAVAAGGDPVGDAIAKAEKQPPRTALQTLLKVEPLAPNRADLLARISIAWSDYAGLADDEHNSVAAEHASRNSFTMAERAVKAGPDNSEAHLSMAYGSGRMTDYVDHAAMLALSRRVRAEAERAVALDSNNAAAYYVLGRWHFGVASVNPLLKFAARVTVGALPPASFKEAAQNMEKAVELAPNNIEYHQHLASVYKAMGKKDKTAQQQQIVHQLQTAAPPR